MQKTQRIFLYVVSLCALLAALLGFTNLAKAQVTCAGPSGVGSFPNFVIQFADATTKGCSYAPTPLPPSFLPKNGVGTNIFTNFIHIGRIINGASDGSGTLTCVGAGCGIKTTVSTHIEQFCTGTCEFTYAFEDHTGTDVIYDVTFVEGAGFSTWTIPRDGTPPGGFDSKAPMPTISAPTVVNGPFDITITFADVDGSLDNVGVVYDLYDSTGSLFDSFFGSEMGLTNATISNFMEINGGTDGSTYTATITPDGSGSDIGIEVPANVTKDIGGNFNTSTSLSVAIDTSIPDAPTVVPTQNADGTLTVMGTGEPGAEVTIVFPDGTSVTVTADISDGSYSVTSVSPQTSNGNVVGTQEDAAGNTSDPTTVFVDVEAPDAPVVEEVVQNGDGTLTVSGTGEPGATVTVIFPDGTEGSVTVASDGTYTVTSDTPQQSGTVSVSQTDESGNTSPSTDVDFVSTMVEDTQAVISGFMLDRANHILQTQPRLIDFMQGKHLSRGGPLGAFNLSGNEQNVTFGFSSSLSKLRKSKEGAEIAKGLLQSDAAGDSSLAPGEIDVWAQVAGAWAETDNADSNVIAAFLGSHYVINSDLMIGGLVQFDWADSSNDISGSSIDGHGWMVGPYVVGRMPGQQLYYEARLGWGRSSNDVSPFGTYTDSFDTERVLANGKLSGRYQIDGSNWSVDPTLSASYYKESQESYIDSLGNFIPGQDVSLGEVRFGPVFNTTLTLDGGAVLRPELSLSGVWNFSVDEGVNSSAHTLGDRDLRARFDTGFTYAHPSGWYMEALGYYDGIGIGDYESYGGNLGIGIRF